MGALGLLNVPQGLLVPQKLLAGDALRAGQHGLKHAEGSAGTLTEMHQRVTPFNDVPQDALRLVQAHFIAEILAVRQVGAEGVPVLVTMRVTERA